MTRHFKETPAGVGPMSKSEAKELWDATDRSALVLAVEMDADLDGTDNDLDVRYANIENSWTLAGRVDPTLAEGCTRHGAPLASLRQAWQRRKNRSIELRAAIAEKSATARANWRRIMIGGADVTEHVAAMYDALIQSTDWGSGFLDTDEVESILIVGQLAGFEAPGLDSIRAEPPDGSASKEQRLAAWRKQIDAKARALSGEVDAEVENERFLASVAAKTGLSHEAIAEAVDAQRKLEAAESGEAKTEEENERFLLAQSIDAQLRRPG